MTNVKSYEAPEATEDIAARDISMAAQLMDINLQILQESRNTNALLSDILETMMESVTAPQPKLTKEQALEVGTRVAAMDDKRFSSARGITPKNLRPEKPTIPQWAYDLAASLDKIAADRTWSNEEIVAELNDTLVKWGHEPMNTQYIYKARTPDVNFYFWSDGETMWRPIMNNTRPRTVDLIYTATRLAG